MISGLIKHKLSGEENLKKGTKILVVSEEEKVRSQAGQSWAKLGQAGPSWAKLSQNQNETQIEW